MSDLKIDPERFEEQDGDPESFPATGIYVRAQFPDGQWSSVDIYCLTKDSLLGWLKSRGGDNRWAEDVVGILLGHGHLHDPNF